MNRPRKTDRHLPPCVYFKHGRHWYVKRGKWTDLGVDLVEALTAYARIVETPKGGMPALIEEAFASHRATHEPPLAANTIAQYRLAADSLKTIFQQFEPRQVTGTHVAKMMRAGVKKPNMTNRKLTLLRIVFDYAVLEGKADSNPCYGVKRLPEKKRKRYVTHDEFLAIRAQAGPRLQVIMDLQYLTGQRISDVLTLSRRQITDEGILLKPEKTKNSSGKEMLLRWSPELRDAVARAKALNPRVSALTLLHGRTGKAPDYRTVAAQWQAAAKAAGVEDVKPNDPRAKAATDAKRQGKNPRKLLGHTSDAQTERYLRQHETEEADGPSFERTTG